MISLNFFVNDLKPSCVYGYANPISPVLKCMHIAMEYSACQLYLREVVCKRRANSDADKQVYISRETK